MPSDIKHLIPTIRRTERQAMMVWPSVCLSQLRLWGF